MRKNYTQLLAILCLFYSFNLIAQQATPHNHDHDHSHNHRNCAWKAMTDWQITQHPEYAEELKYYKQKVVPKLVEQGLAENKSASTILTIPVVVHVIHNGENVGVGANLSAEQIRAQLDVLNEDFSATNPNYDETPTQWQAASGNPEIQFCLAAFDENGAATTGITRHQMTITGTSSNNSNIENEIKPATFWDPTEYYNIWTVAIPGTTAQGGTVGYAYLPFPSVIGRSFDGSVVDYRWFGGPGFGQSGYKTLTHETGHYLGLPHTFDGEDCGADDNISDTPNIGDATSSIMPNLWCSNGNFPSGPTSCGGTEHMYVNYMDYVNSDYCYTSFSNGQSALMRGVLNGNSNFGGYGSRNGLTSNVSTACVFLGDDAGISSIEHPSGSQLCSDGDITPQVQLTNFGTNTLTTVTIRYQIDGGNAVDMNWTGNLTSGNSQMVSLVAFSPPMGEFVFNVSTLNPNGNTDLQTENDAQVLTTRVTAIRTLPLMEDFEASAFNPTDNGVGLLNPDGDGFMWERTTSVSAYGDGGAAGLFNNFDGTNNNNPFNTLDALLTPVYDFTAVSGAQLTFDVAYAPWSNGSSFFADTLMLLVSTDCGNFYNQEIYKSGGAALATASATNVRFIPTDNEWKTITIDLSAFDGMDDVSIAFVNFSGWGNQLFLDNIQLTVPCQMAAVTFSQAVSCFGQCDASVTTQASGGNGNFTYQWDTNTGNQLTATATGLCAGTYSVTVSDDMGCSAVSTVEVTQPEDLTLELLAADVTSPGANDGSITATTIGGVAGYQYTWAHGATGAVLTNLSPGAYTVTVTDQNGCTKIGQTSVGAGNVDCSSFTASIQSSSISCFGAQDGAAQLMLANGVGPYNYLWSDQSTAISNSDLGPGLIQVTITDANGCWVIAEDFIEEPSLLTVSVSSVDESFFGQNDGTAAALISGGSPGYTYLWSNGATTSNVTNLSPGEYVLTITDQNGCTTTGQTNLAAGPVDCSGLLTFIEVSATSCFGGADGEAMAMVTGGMPPYSYFWSDGTLGALNTDLMAGTYFVTTTDNLGCIQVEQVQIEQPAIIALTVTGVDESAPGAQDGIATAVASGGTPPFTYHWNTQATTATIGNLMAGIYTVTITDQNGCGTIGETQIETTPVDCSSLAITTVVDQVSCFGQQDGNIQVVVQGGQAPFTYQWNNGHGLPIMSDLSSGTYTVSVYDAFQCLVVQTVSISEPDELISNIQSTDGLCGQIGAASVGPEGGQAPYTYQWSTGAITAGIPIQQSGIYTITLSDALNCTLIDEVEVMVNNELLSITAEESGLVCFGDANGAIDLTINSGQAPFVFSWNNGSTSEDIEELMPGTYTVLITDALGCTIFESFILEAPQALQVNCTVSPTPGTSGETIEASVVGGSGPYTYAWSNGNNSVINPGLAPGAYALTVTDVEGCTSFCEVELTGTTSHTNLKHWTSLEVFPNPSKGELNVHASWQNSASTDLMLFNIIGQQLLSRTFNSETITTTIDLKEYPNGTYWIVLQSEAGRMARKVILTQ
ncbi:MAG: T9SS type A sorting domain-containing protein [Bacteroidota bacterium]